MRLGFVTGRYLMSGILWAEKNGATGGAHRRSPKKTGLDGKWAIFSA
jgi:hypothetical protein